MSPEPGRRRARRVAVVGASSGLGRSIGIGLARRGDHVALLARRRPRLDVAILEAGDRAVAVTCDVTDETACTEAVDEAAERLGGLDGLVYATGSLTIQAIEDTDADTWLHLFRTNVIGAATATRAALPHLRATAGRAVYLSSISAGLTPAWPYLGAYSSSKAALEKMVEAWREEHPEVGFTRLAVGDCAGGEGHSATELVNDVDPELFEAAVTEWHRRGHITGSLVDAADLVDAVDGILASGASLGAVTLAPGPARA